MLDFQPVALDFMNRDHAAFSALHAEGVRLLEEADFVALDELLEKMLEHTREHFAEEEHAMQQGNFPPYPMHKMEHDRVLAEMVRQISRWRGQRDLVSFREFMLVALPDWFTKHVNLMDAVTARYLSTQAEL